MVEKKLEEIVKELEKLNESYYQLTGIDNKYYIRFEDSLFRAFEIRTNKDLKQLYNYYSSEVNKILKNENFRLNKITCEYELINVKVEYKINFYLYLKESK